MNDTMFKCTCDCPNKGGPHDLDSECYVWYKLKVKHRGRGQANPVVIRTLDGYAIDKETNGN